MRWSTSEASAGAHDDGLHDCALIHSFAAGGNTTAALM